MAEAAEKLPVVEDVTQGEENKGTQEPQLNEVEQEAYHKGWRPEAEYEGEDRWIPAEEFMDRAPVYEGLSKQNKKLKRMEEMLKQLAERNR